MPDMAVNKTIYMIGGTTEANAAASRLEEEGYRVVVSVATPFGARMAAGTEADVGAKDAAAMAAQAAAAEAAAIIDCSHPFAVGASSEARRAAAMAGLPYIRYERPREEAPGAVTAGSFAEAVAYLKERGERAFLTIGSRNLHHFTEAGVDFMARVLPVADSINECTRLGMDARDILAACPPFSVDFNRICIRHARARVLVTKDAGRAGGIGEKLEAAAAEGIDVLVIARPGEEAAAGEAVSSPEELVGKLKEAISGGKP